MPGFNLASRSDAERQAVHADLAACRLLHYRKEKGRQWIEDQLAELQPEFRELVRQKLNSRLGLKYE